MRFRSTSQEQASSNPRSTGSSDAASSTTGSPGIGRKLAVLALGLGVVAYAVSRYLGRSPDRPSRADVEDLQDWVPSAETVRERTTDAVPGDFQEIPIGERSAEGDADGSDDPESIAETAADAVAESVGDATDDAGSEELDDAETNVDMTDGERSPAEITERADEDVPEPGEMAVDEDVADELVETDEADEAGDEPDEE